MVSACLAGSALAVLPTPFYPATLQSTTTPFDPATLQSTTTTVAGASASTAVEVLRVGKCSIAPGGPTPEVIAQWEDELRQAATATVANGSVFADTDNLYVYDRCFVPRRVCKVYVRASDALLLLPRDGPEEVTLQPRAYDVVIGAAQSIGAVARKSFALLLEQSGSLPIINLGRGSASPDMYTESANWPVVAPVFYNARSIILCVMAGRSSPNSATAVSGKFGLAHAKAFKQLREWYYSKDPVNATRGEQLRLESLENARRDYVELVRRIRAGSPSGQPKPRILLVWFSACPISGCSSLAEFPQYYLNRTGVRNVIASLGAELGAEIIDASTFGLPPAQPIPIDQCSACRSNASAVCEAGTARVDAKHEGRTCGSACGYVKSAYYPDDNGHEHAAHLIGAALQASPMAMTLPPTTHSPPPIAHLPPPPIAHSPPPPIGHLPPPPIAHSPPPPIAAHPPLPDAANCTDQQKSGVTYANGLPVPCGFFKTNPATCDSYSSARTNCPISCGTCPTATVHPVPHLPPPLLHSPPTLIHSPPPPIHSPPPPILSPPPPPTPPPPPPHDEHSRLPPPPSPPPSPPRCVDLHLHLHLHLRLQSIIPLRHRLLAFHPQTDVSFGAR